jgi:hypothetical protein
MPGAPPADGWRRSSAPRLDGAERQADNRRMTISTRAVWAAYGAVAAAMIATYSRVAPAELYNVSGTGLAGGLSRALVYLNFPVALVAAPLGLLAAGRIGTRGARVAGVVAAALCAVVVVPGVVDQSDLDARWVNVVPATGVSIALVLELLARPQRVRIGRWTIVTWIALGIVSLVWIAAELGFHLTFVVFRAGELWHGEAAVHLGHHHGLDGAMLAATALVLLQASRRLLSRAYACLMLAYGLVNCIQDAWTEQVVKRDWTTHAIPNALHPAVNGAWLAIVVIAAVVLAFVLAREAEERAPVAAP